MGLIVCMELEYIGFIVKLVCALIKCNAYVDEKYLYLCTIIIKTNFIHSIKKSGDRVARFRKLFERKDIVRQERRNMKKL